MNTPEEHLLNNLKKELRETPNNSLDEELVLAILNTAKKYSLDDDSKKRQDSIRALIKQSVNT